MDQLKNSFNSTGNTGAVNQQQPAGAQKEDYLDKAFDMGAKKSGHQVDRNTAEKITDGARGLFEKATGKQVNSKISN
ncbi:hypothetical protein BD289DRAFT_372358 [Coniella lustricola]|uniref:Uncharacterized protein n=1 Tax=Coniella lustricola TaxID=2025994 RepID=A0A2T3A2E5_9PEZI|nr:hypothetical protein BD289DRAFT_372358 [Coniella lustricola]